MGMYITGSWDLPVFFLLSSIICMHHNILVGFLVSVLMTNVSAHAWTPPHPSATCTQAKEQKRALKKQAQKQMKMVRVG